MEEGIRPRERVARDGVAALSDHELLALLLRTGHRGKGAEDLAVEVMDLAQGCLCLREGFINALNGPLFALLIHKKTH